MAKTNDDVTLDDIFNVGKSESVPTMVKITKIAAVEGGDKDMGSFVIVRPFKIKIETKEKEVVFDDFTTRTAYAREWVKKFYINPSGYIGYTRDDILLAIIEVAKLKKEHPADEMSIDEKIDNKALNVKKEFEGWKFEAVLREFEGKKFIDWVSTFEHNGVPVPAKEAIEASRNGGKTVEHNFVTSNGNVEGNKTYNRDGSPLDESKPASAGPDVDLNDLPF